MKHQLIVAAAVVSAAFSVVGCSSADETQSTSDSDLAVEQATEAWGDSMHQTEAPHAGCFEANFPSKEWEEVACDEVPSYRSVLPSVRTSREQIVGNGADYVAQAPSGHGLQLGRR